jgi:hypothetical protein
MNNANCKTCTVGIYCTNHYHKNVCGFCGVDYLGKKIQLHCSRECSGKASGFKKGVVTWNKGAKGLQVAWNKGRPWIEFRGENHPRYISDRSKIAKRQERSDTAYKEWRKTVWFRDLFTCKMNSKDCSGRIEAHHILSWADFPELRYEVNNGITLCHFHHPRKRNDEMMLEPLFQELVSTKAKTI